jgi:hypothetical protein
MTYVPGLAAAADAPPRVIKCRHEAPAPEAPVVAAAALAVRASWPRLGAAATRERWQLLPMLREDASPLTRRLGGATLHHRRAGDACPRSINGCPRPAERSRRPPLPRPRRRVVGRRGSLKWLRRQQGGRRDAEQTEDPPADLASDLRRARCLLRGARLAERVPRGSRRLADRRSE